MSYYSLYSKEGFLSIQNKNNLISKTVFVHNTRSARIRRLPDCRAGNYDTPLEGVVVEVAQGPPITSQRHAHTIQPVTEPSEPLHGLRGEFVGHAPVPEMIAEHPADPTFGQLQELIESEDLAAHEPIGDVTAETHIQNMARLVAITHLSLP